MFFSKLSKDKCDRGAPRRRYEDQLKRKLAEAGIDQRLADVRIRQGRMEVSHQTRSSALWVLQSEQKYSPRLQKQIVHPCTHV